MSLIAPPSSSSSSPFGAGGTSHLGDSGSSTSSKPMIANSQKNANNANANTTNSPFMVTLHFTSTNKMSLFSLEKRIDYHLSRIMKGHRLINFKNSIERLPTEKRICECIIEVLMSSVNLIKRKWKIIAESKSLVTQLGKMTERVMELNNATIAATGGGGGSGTLFHSGEYARESGIKLSEIKSLAIGLEQIMWALNSNKEHIKYIVKVFTIPEQYQRSEFNSDLSSIVPLRQAIVECIEHCEMVITICRMLRNKLSDALINWFVCHY